MTARDDVLVALIEERLPDEQINRIMRRLQELDVANHHFRRSEARAKRGEVSAERHALARQRYTEIIRPRG